MYLNLAIVLCKVNICSEFSREITKTKSREKKRRRDNRAENIKNERNRFDIVSVLDENPRKTKYKKEDDKFKQCLRKLVRCGA